MKLKDKDYQESNLGLPSSHREWWDIGNGYEIFVQIDNEECGLGVYSPEGNITLKVSQYLGIDTSPENIKFGDKADGRELYLTSGIDCVILNYTQPKNYKDLLEKIELIVNNHFKNK